MPALLIRHAHVGSCEGWSGEDKMRLLSVQGRRKVGWLSREVGRYAPQRILSSPHLRCLTTVEALARRLSVEVEPTGDLAEGRGTAAVGLVRALADEKVALCTHGDVITDVFVALADEDRVDLGTNPDRPRAPFGSFDANEGRFIKATYIEPPSLRAGPA